MPRAGQHPEHDRRTVPRRWCSRRGTSTRRRPCSATPSCGSTRASGRAPGLRGQQRGADGPGGRRRRVHAEGHARRVRRLLFRPAVLREGAGIRQHRTARHVGVRAEPHPGEVRLLLLHLLESRDIAADYFFFDENCSYNLLFLLDAARPEARLTDRMDRLWVIPMDSARRSSRRGSRTTSCTAPRGPAHPARRSLLPDGRPGCRRISEGKAPAASALEGPAPDAEKARALDLAALLAQYRIAKKEMEHREFQERFHAILSARTRLRGAEPLPDRRARRRRTRGIRARARTSGPGGGGARGSSRRGSARRTTTTPTPRDGYTDGALIEVFSGRFGGTGERRLRLDGSTSCGSSRSTRSTRSSGPSRGRRASPWRRATSRRRTTGWSPSPAEGSARRPARRREGLRLRLGGSGGGRLPGLRRLVPGGAGRLRRRHGGGRPRLAALAGGARRVGGRSGRRGGPDLSLSLRQGWRLARDWAVKADVSARRTRRIDRTEGRSP